jgi:hypothetical protein
MIDKRNRSEVESRHERLEASLVAWERGFRTDFAKDRGAFFEPLITRFGLKIDAEDMLEGTIDFVTASAALADLDGVEIKAFLADQRYDAQAPIATHALTFDVAGRGAARLLVTPALTSIDLADLYEYPWNRLELVGYSGFWLSRLDGNALEPSEVEELDRVVTGDIRFDYAEDEVSFFFDPDSYEGALAVTVYDTPLEGPVP